MKVENLVKGREYWYTAGEEWVKVIYLFPTTNAYLFEDGLVKNYLSRLSVEHWIEEMDEFKMRKGDGND